MIQSSGHSINHYILQTLNYTSASVQLPRNSYFIDINYSLGIKTSKSTPEDFNGEPELRIINTIDHLSPDEMSKWLSLALGSLLSG